MFSLTSESITKAWAGHVSSSVTSIQHQRWSIRYQSDMTEGGTCGSVFLLIGGKGRHRWTQKSFMENRNFPIAITSCCARLSNAAKPWFNLFRALIFVLLGEKELATVSGRNTNPENISISFKFTFSQSLSCMCRQRRGKWMQRAAV